MASANKTLTFLSDDPPLKSKGSGISVLLYNINNALKGHYLQNVVTFCRQSRAGLNEIISDNEGIDVFICDKSYTSLYKVARFGLLKKAFQFFSFLFALPSLLNKYNNPGNVFVTVVGASISPVYKAWLLMLFAKKSKHCVYIVDDLKGINEKYNNRLELFLISVFLKRTIVKADKLLTISEGLRKIYLDEYNKNSIVLLPHYKKVDSIPNEFPNHDKGEFTFLYTGGLNILYNDSLKYFGKVIEHLNKTDLKVKYKLIVQTYSSKDDFDRLGFDNSFIKYSTTEDRGQLLLVYKNCDAFLIPYSFNLADAGLVSTSFPQKTAEIIQYGKPLLLFGPAYGSVMEFFRLNSLNYVCNEYNDAALSRVIKAMCAERNSFSADRYIEVYNSNLSANAVVKLFNSLLISLLNYEN